MRAIGVLAIIAQGTHGLSEVRVRCHDSPGVIEGTEIFGGVKAHRGTIGKSRGSRTIPRSPDRLRGINEQVQVLDFADGPQGGHITGRAIQMHGQNGPGGRGAGIRGGRRVEQGREWVDFRGNRAGTGLANAHPRGWAGKRRDDDIIPRSNPRGFQEKRDGIATRRYAHGMLDPVPGCQFPLKSGQLRSHQNLTAAQYPVKRRVNFRALLSDPPTEIKKWDAYLHA
jgi:hypothetical protein